MQHSQTKDYILRLAMKHAHLYVNLSLKVEICIVCLAMSLSGQFVKSALTSMI